MKYIKALLEYLAFIQVLFMIYGLCGSYEQGFIDDLEFLKYLLLSGSALIVNILGIKAMTAAIRSKNRKFKKSDNNRHVKSVKLVRLNHTIKDSTNH